MKAAAYIFFILFSPYLQGQHLTIVHLTCESKTNPQGIENARPSLSWNLISDQRSVLQTAYRILVATDSSLLKKGQANVWDSKKQTTTRSILVPYNGKKLQPATTYYW